MDAGAPRRRVGGEPGGDRPRLELVAVDGEALLHLGLRRLEGREEPVSEHPNVNEAFAEIALDGRGRGRG